MGTTDMGVLNNIKETAQDTMGTGPVAELEEFFDTDWGRFDHRSIPKARELLDNLKRRREQEQQKRDRPSRHPDDGDRPEKVVREAERRIEWLDEQIKAGNDRIEELQARRDELREEAARVEAEAQAEMKELAAEALDNLEDVASVVGKVRAARQRIIDARKEADMRTNSHRPHPAKTAEKEVQKLRATLQKLAETNE
jgi:DNA repair exonuclease SbcCD ATPase subunit